jgi:hypothetical protein
MVFVYTVALSAGCFWAGNRDEWGWVSLATLLLTLIYQIKQCASDQQRLFSTLKSGELLHQLAYLAWMQWPRQDYIFLAPLVLSNVGKIYAIFHEKSEDNQATIEELIKFQAKLELLLCVILLAKTFPPSLPSLLLFLSFAILCKLKYSFYFAAQKAYVELHFLLDNVTKRWGARRAYHLLHALLARLGGVSNDAKEIAY